MIRRVIGLLRMPCGLPPYGEGWKWCGIRRFPNLVRPFKGAGRGGIFAPFRPGAGEQPGAQRVHINSFSRADFVVIRIQFIERTESDGSGRKKAERGSRIIPGDWGKAG